MKLKNVSIKNYRGLQDFSIDISNQTVLVGGNNTCKTSLLSAINLTLYPGFYYGPGLLSEYDFYNKQFIQPENQILINLTFTDLIDEELKYFGDHVEPIDQDGNVIDGASGTSIFDTAPKILRLHFASKYADEEITCGVYYTRHGDEISVSKLDRQKIGFQYLDLNRFLERSFSLGGNSTMCRIMRNRNIDLRQQQHQILTHIPEVSSTLIENIEFRDLLGSLETRFQEYAYLAESRDDAPSVKYELSDLTFSDINRSIQLFIQTAHSNQALPLTRQGSGTQNALLLALLIHLGEIQGNTIVAVDEPELSLHPHAQRYLMGKLKEAGFQLLIATHSPAVAETFNLNEIRLLQYRDGRLQAFSLDTNAIEAGPANTFVFLKRQLVEAYFSQAVLLVEGDTEEGSLLAFNISLRRIGRGLDLHKQELTLFNTQGYTDISQILDALHPLPIRSILFIDNDNEESFYTSLVTKVDGLIRSPYTPAGNDFEGMIAWQSPFDILAQVIEQQMLKRELSRRLPQKFKHRVNQLRQNGEGDNNFIQQLLDLDPNPLYFRCAIPILKSWEESIIEEKGVVRSLLADIIREVKGCRPAYEWASIFPADQLPHGIVELFEIIQHLLAGEIEPRTQYVLT